MKRIVLVGSGGEAESWRLTEGCVVIGSGAYAKIRIADESLAVEHAEICEEFGRTRIRDLGSQAGTFVNGTRVVDAYIEQDDRVQLGRVTLVFDAGQRLVGLSGAILPGAGDYEFRKEISREFATSNEVVNQAIARVDAARENLSAIPLIPAASGLPPVTAVHQELDDQFERQKRALAGLEREILRRRSELADLETEEKARLSRQEVEEFPSIGGVGLEEGGADAEVEAEVGLEPTRLALPRTLEELEEMEQKLVEGIQRMIPVPAQKSGHAERVVFRPDFDHALDVLDFPLAEEPCVSPWGGDLKGQVKVSPIGFSGFALATGGRLFQTTAAARRSLQPVLVMADRDLSRALRAVLELRSDGRKVFLGWSGRRGNPVEQAIRDGRVFQALREGLRYCEGVICDRSADERLLLQLSQNVPVHYWGMPCPVDELEWNFSTPLGSRAGILIASPVSGELSDDFARYLSVFFDAATFASTSVTLMVDRSNCPWIEQVAAYQGTALRIIDVPADYESYLKLAATHRVMVSLTDPSSGGCHDLDALLCRTVCLSAGRAGLPWIGFPRLAASTESEKIADLLVRFLRDDVLHHSTVEAAREKVEAACGFQVTRDAVEVILRGGLGELEAILESKAG